MDLMLVSGLFLILSISLLLFQYRVIKGEFGILEPSILFQIYFIIQLPLSLFLGVSFSIPGYVSLSAQQPFSHIVILAILIFIGHVSYVMGLILAGKAVIAPPVFGYKKLNKRYSNSILILIYLFGYFCFFYLLFINGGYQSFIDNRESWRAGGMSGQGWVIFPATTLLSIASICFAIINKQLFSGRLGLILYFLLLIVTIAPASQMGFRGMLLWPVLQLLLAYHLKIHKINVRKAFVAVFLILVIFTVYGILREASFVVTDGLSLSTIMDFIKLRPEFIFFVFLRSKGADVLSVVASGDINISEFKYFLPAIFEAITIPIPSSLWAGKPTPLSVEFSRVFFGLDGGVSPTIIAEAYWHAGIAGIFIVLLISGIMTRVFSNSLLRYINHTSISIVLLSCFPLTILLSESLQAALNSLVLVYIASTFIAIILSVFS